MLDGIKTLFDSACAGDDFIVPALCVAAISSVITCILIELVVWRWKKCKSN